MAKPDPKTRLLKLLAQLPEPQQVQLLEFAEFLVERHPQELQAPGEPMDIPRPENETVVSAMKRLRESYPMLDQELLLHETSALLSAHLMQGRSAESVIDDLEQVFRKHYDALRSDSQ